jgi:glycosyltransferase involved in cell wall biosynthesis
MHIVAVCQVFYPDSQSTSQLLTDLFQELAGGSVQITVITGYTAKKDGAFPPRREMLGNVEIRRTGIAIGYKTSLWLRGLHYFCYVVGSTGELWKLRKSSLVFGITNPPFTPVWLWLLSFLFLERYQVMLQDIYPDGLIAIGSLKRDGVLARLWRAANRRAFQKAERVLILGRDMGELLESVYAVSPDRITYVPHWSLLSATEPIPVEKTQMLEKLGLQKKFIVQYSGNMGLWHDIDSIVQAAAKLKDRPDIHFLLIGDGVRRAEALQLSEQLQLRNMTWYPFQPKESLHDLLSCCHVALISQREGLKGVAVPCKLYGILASGRAVLAMVPAGSEIDLTVREEDCGRIIRPGNVDGLVSAILELAGNRPLLAQMDQNAFRAYQQKYTLSAAIPKFRALWGLPEG